MEIITNKKLAYFIFTYSIFGIYLIFAILSYNKILNSIDFKLIYSDDLGKLLLVKYLVISLAGLWLGVFLKKKHIWEFPIMIVSNLVDIYGMAGITSVGGAILKYAGIYDTFIKQIAIVTLMVFVVNFIYGIKTLHDLEDSKTMLMLGIICLVLILLMNIVNVRYRIIHIIVDVLLLIWFSNGIAIDSQNIIKDYDKINDKIKLGLNALQNAMYLCDDLIFVFGQLLKLTADEKA